MSDMKEYHKFLESKIVRLADSGIDVADADINDNLFPFQKFIVKKALKKGRYAIFANCGLGKTIMQLEWAMHVSKHTEKPVLVLCPLAVSLQTIGEGEKFGIEVRKYSQKEKIEKGIWISNYEQIDNIDCDIFSGIVLDESSILKSFTGKYKNLIIDRFKETPYKLACTATPAPNDLNEIGNHSEFLGVMDATDMRMRWFVRDEGMNNYRLKGHADKEFYGWIGSWASVLRMPGDIGFSDEGYVLPPLNIVEKSIITAKKSNGKLFNDFSVNATNFNAELKITKVERLSEAVDIVKQSAETFIVWIKQNEEGDYLRKSIPGAVEVKGSDSIEYKENNLLGFAQNKLRILITKPKIAQFGMNFQCCNNQIFASLDFSFESLFQSIRRSYRFGQKQIVNIYIITTDTMQNVISTIKRKEKEFNNMMEGVTSNVNNQKYEISMSNKKDEIKTDKYHLINGDSCEVMKELASDSVDFSVFSPPFSTLFTYSDNIRDLGNCANHEQFYENYQFVLGELYRMLKPGRLIAVHTKDLAVYKNSSGYSGLYDFTGKMHRLTEDAGFKYHSKVVIWLDPVLEMQRTKTQRLLYKQVTSDSSYSGIGMPEYVTIFRKWEGSEEDWMPVTNLNKSNFSLEMWQRWASPVWSDILRTDVLSNYRHAGDERDEKHICPLQLGVVERCIALWSNPGDTVFTPFMGIGSEIYKAIEMGRKGVGIELKESYYNVAVKNIKNIELKTRQKKLFA